MRSNNNAPTLFYMQLPYIGNEVREWDARHVTYDFKEYISLDKLTNVNGS